MINYIFNFLIAINDLENEEEKLKYQNIITILINNENFPDDLLKNFLINLNKVILHNVNNPLIFSDYLINKASKGNIIKLEDFDNKIFALSSLFILLTKYKLDYDKYYELLYKLISIKLNNLTIFDSKYKNRIFKILELSLKSSQIPLIIICSFIKKLSRISLISNDSNIISIITLIILIIQNHPKTIGMLMYKRKVKKEKENLIENSTFDWNKFNSKIANQIKLENENDIKNNEDNNIIELNEDNYTDMFNDNEINPYKTNAHFCSLWELYTLKNHFNMKIRKLVNNLSFNFLPREFALENIKEKELIFDIEKTNTYFYINE
jgi:U3 small nucleolar RNA-associated protein 19